MSNFSVSRLRRELSIGQEEATKLRELLRWHDHKSVDRALDYASKVLDAHGVEALHDPSRWDNYYTDIVALYVNTGDTYATTLVYDIDRDTYLVQGWGDWVERYERRTGRLLP